MAKRYIHETAIVGIGLRYLQGCVETKDEQKYGTLVLPDDIYIGPFAIIGFNCIIGNGVIIDSYCKIDPGTVIGANTLITYRATIGSSARIGEDCVVGGNVSEGTVVGDRCRTFGKLIHKHTDSTISWDHHDIPEASVTLLHDSFVAHDAVVIGGVKVGPCSYVCSGAVITKDVPPYHIGYSCNQIVHYSQWRGELATNPLFKIKI